LSGKQQLLICADDVNIWSENRNAINKNTEALLQAGDVTGLEADADETKYMLYQVTKMQDKSLISG
jgi:hypothetical protein